MDQNMDMVDQISQLPVPIMQHILSFLPIKEVVKTRVLSKTWNHVWNTFPILEFNRAFVLGILGDHWLVDCMSARNWYNVFRKRDELLNFVEQTLLSRYRQMLSINKFTLCIPYCDLNCVPLIDRCIRYAIECDVKELDIDITIMDRIQYYKLPEIMFHHFGAKLPNARYSSLKRLFLSGVYVDDHAVQKLLNSFPGIEDLSFSICCGFKWLQVSGFLQLKKVSVQNCLELERVDIETPNLQYFHYARDRVPCEINIASCKNLKTLILYAATMTEQSFHDHISVFPLLENLVLCDCNMEHIKISSHCLKELILDRCKKLVEVKIDAPYLCSFKYWGSMVSLSMNALALSRVELTIQPEVIDIFWYVKLMEFLGQLNHAKELILIFKRELQAIIIPEKLRQSLIPPSLSANHLTLQIEQPTTHQIPSTHWIVESVDGVLWMFSHLDGISMMKAASGSYNISFKFVYEKQLEREENLRWQHCLKEAKIIIEKQFDRPLWPRFERAEAVLNLKKFFFENAKNLEKVDVIALV